MIQWHMFHYFNRINQEKSLIFLDEKDIHRQYTRQECLRNTINISQWSELRIHFIYEI